MMYRVLVVVALSVATVVAVGPPAGVKDTQNPRDVPLPPGEAVKRFKAPDDVRVTLFAGEPDVAQPIAITFDDRGRLWVAECYSYPAWKADGKDRVLIFEDADGDGTFDKRTVFLDNLPNLTGLAWGHGGAWLLCAPQLLFVPDRNRDDVPDGKPEVVLDGWTLKAKHNVVNGMTWGPDGWLYGRHGITADSLVGAPGTPDDRRVRLNCSIWRYHPTRKLFDVVCNGTTNPWGLDFDEHGEGFFTNCVIGHLWHMIPGARYVRMYGRDFNPHAYELIDACSDHLHWGGGHWTSSRGGQGTHNEAGGGHAHSGAMVYLGDNLPDRYRNGLFTCNIHGNRVNHDRLERKGCGYVGRHSPDFATSSDLWFRGTALDYGADGSVYVADWCDFGECHDDDGVHRTSGRIYRFAIGAVHAKGLDLAQKTDLELAELQLHKNDWHVRHARVLLAERAAVGRPMAQVHARLRELFDSQKDVTRKLRALWALYSTGGAPRDWLVKQLGHKEEHVRKWAVRLLCDEPLSPELGRKLADLASAEPSGLVRLSLASALQRLPLSSRLALASPLAARPEDAADACLPLLVWYGIEPAVTAHRAEALELAASTRFPKLRSFIARRLAEDDKALADVITLLARLRDTQPRRDLLVGLREGFKGRKSVKQPAGWSAAYADLLKSDAADIRMSARLLAVLFDDAGALADMGKALDDRALAADERAGILRALVDKGVPGLLPQVVGLLQDGALRPHALRALAAFDDDQTPALVLKLYPALSGPEKQDALATLASRPAYALALLDAVEQKKVPRSDVSAFTARQMIDLRDKAVAGRLEKVWGVLRQTPAQKKKLIEDYKKKLTPEVLAKADPSKGRAVYNQVCAQCHLLHGEGGKIGPDLTGSDRANLHYVLENTLDPSAVIGGDYRLVNVYTTQGRLVSGLVVEETDRALTMQTATEKVVLARGDIEDRQVSAVSMMPEGLLDPLTPDQFRDLVAYLASKKQVPLPK